MLLFFSILIFHGDDMDEKRLNELYNRAYEKSYKVFTPFLNLEEQSILAQAYLPCEKYGGYDIAERVVAGFGDALQKADFPIAYLVIAPVKQKFADDLTHRDFLGALMNLGIKREMLGDIIVADNQACLICLEQIAAYVADNLHRVKHTDVTVTQTDEIPAGAAEIPESKEFIAASLRLDALISCVYKLSRSKAAKLFAADKVFVNSRLIQNTSYQVKERDIVSVRGMGRFQFDGVLKKTKKDNLVLNIILYK